LALVKLRDNVLGAKRPFSDRKSVQGLLDETLMLTPIPVDVERLATIVVDAGLQVHKALGPGLLESVYEHCLAYELTKRELSIRRQVSQPIFYDGVRIDAALRIDLVVGGVIIVEIKSADAILPVHKSQLLTYLKLSGCRLGFLMNFNVPLFKNGIQRMVA
jgi:GxxExxY protein